MNELKARVLDSQHTIARSHMRAAYQVAGRKNFGARMLFERSLISL